MARRDPGGRPRSIDDLVVAKLEEVLRLGVTLEIACSHAGIERTTYYREQKRNPAFATKMEAARNYARLAAGNVVMESIVNKKDVNTAKWWLEKKHGDEFGGAKDETVINNQLNIIGNVTSKQLASELIELFSGNDAGAINGETIETLSPATTGISAESQESQNPES